jgi:hypothetical protein
MKIRNRLAGFGCCSLLQLGFLFARASYILRKPNGAVTSGDEKKERSKNHLLHASCRLLIFFTKV